MPIVPYLSYFMLHILLYVKFDCVIMLLSCISQYDQEYKTWELCIISNIGKPLENMELTLKYINVFGFNIIYFDNS